MKGFPYTRKSNSCWHKSSKTRRNKRIYIDLDFFRKDSRFPKVCTSIRDYLSPWHFIGKRTSKRREVNIWLTILHSMDSLVQWDQRVWNGDMAKAKVEMGSSTACDRNVENHATEILRCQHQRVCQKQNQNLTVTDIWCYLSLVVVFNHNVQPQQKFCVGSLICLYIDVFTRGTCQCSQIYLSIYITTMDILCILLRSHENHQTQQIEITKNHRSDSIPCSNHLNWITPLIPIFLRTTTQQKRVFVFFLRQILL